jgi:Flp pilus assembly protein TadD
MLIYNYSMKKLLKDPSSEHLQFVIKLYTEGQLQQALSHSTKMLEEFPNSVVLHNISGVCNAGLLQFDAAIESYKKAIKIKPNYADVYNNMAAALKENGDLEAAIDNCKEALKIKPYYAEAYINMGNALQVKGDLEAAIDNYNKALKIKPGHAEAYYNMGIALKDNGDLEAAIDSYKQTLKIQPNHAEVNGNLGLAFNELGDHENALLSFKKSRELIRGNNPVNPIHKSFLTISKAKIQHDIDQFNYLAELGYDVKKFQALAELYRSISLEIDWSSREIQPLSNDHQELLKETYNRIIHLLDAPKLVNGALSCAFEREKITKIYFQHDHGLTYIDNFLTPAALDSIRKFLLGSTIWFDIKIGGYLGAYLKEGLACPLLLQIAEDLRNTLPEIFKNHQLKHLWAYKYDSRAYKNDNGLTGIKAHADQAAVNVNFWITPANANLNPKSGGLIVYNAPAPLEWDFKAYNSYNSKERIAEYLKNISPDKSIVPYKENRAVIFNSNLIHETDRFEFKEGYEDRRINVTMLFGPREG